MAGAGAVALEDLLDTPQLQQYAAAFLRAEFDNVEWLLSMTPEEWDEMLDTIEKESQQDGVSMKPAHKMQIKSRLRDMRARKDGQRSVAAAARQTSLGMQRDESAAAGPASPRVLQSKRIDATVIADDSDVTKASVLFGGFTCVEQHWMLCFALSVFFMLAGVFMLVLLNSLADEPSAEDDGPRSGAWRFVYAAMVTFFVLSPLACCLCLVAYRRNPEAAECGPFTIGGGATAAAGGMLACGGLAVCLEDCMVSLGNCGAKCDAPSFNCGRCAMPECGVCAPGACDACCKGASCDCLPLCGDVESCLQTTAKILCCRCEIRV